MYYRLLLIDAYDSQVYQRYLKRSSSVAGIADPLFKQFDISKIECKHLILDYGISFPYVTL